MTNLGGWGGSEKSGPRASSGSGSENYKGLRSAQEELFEGPEGSYVVGRAAVGTFTRDVSVASGTQDITGLGAKPYAIILHGVIASAKHFCSGLSNGTVNVVASTRDDVGADTWNFGSEVENFSILIEQASPAAYSGTASIIDDGFRITWTKTGSPTGTMSVHYLALFRG